VDPAAVTSPAPGGPQAASGAGPARPLDGTGLTVAPADAVTDMAAVGPETARTEAEAEVAAASRRARRRWRDRHDRSSTRPHDLAPLVDAARGGDTVALDELVRATYTDAYTLAFRLTGNEDDARDVVQEAYLRAQRGLGRFRGDAQFTTWLYRITANCASSMLVKRRRTATEPLADDAPVVDLREDRDPEWRAASQEERAVVSAALADLPPRLRQVIVLRDIYDLPHQAIAAELGISEAAAKVRLHRARRRLKEALESRGSGVQPG
jgi:RNA polymerase sigma-70 factor (ECF subfamily)